jgi:hypothetical protein
MKTPVDARLREEVQRFGLRHTCDDCVHFTGDACIHEYPTAQHRLPIALATHEIVFCKEHEVG